MARGDTITPPDTTKIPIGHIKGICESLGFEPSRVSEIVMTPREVVVTCWAIPKTGATIVHRIPVVRD